MGGLGRRRDLGRFGVARVVLPQPDLRRGVVTEPRVEPERPPLDVDRERGRARRVDADADDARGVEVGGVGGLRQRGADGALEAVEVVLRVLAREVRFGRVEEDASIP